jgi:hypothetical protein
MKGKNNELDELDYDAIYSLCFNCKGLSNINQEYWDKCFSMLRKAYEPKTEVIFNEPATILYKDGNKYVCKCDKEDKFSEELGLALCLLKSFGVSYSDFEELLKGAKRQGVKNEKN